MKLESQHVALGCLLTGVAWGGAFACRNTAEVDESPLGTAALAVSGDAGGDATGDAGDGSTGPCFAATPPTKPAGLTEYFTGNANDKVPSGMLPGGFFIMGGGTDVDDAFKWARDRAGGGDVVVLRTTGTDGYNDYIYSTIGGGTQFNSVSTLLVTTSTLANSDYVCWRISHAEFIFIAGGDQGTYLSTWKGTTVQSQLVAAWNLNHVIGGTSAGAMIQSQFIYSAIGDGGVDSPTALANPYNPLMTFDRNFLSIPPLANTIVDTHFVERDRLGRLAAFLGRLYADGWSQNAIGIGLDVTSAIVSEKDGGATLMGTNKAYFVRMSLEPSPQVTSGNPLNAIFSVSAAAPDAGDTFSLPTGDGTPQTFSANGGTLSPASTSLY